MWLFSYYLKFQFFIICCTTSIWIILYQKVLIMSLKIYYTINISWLISLISILRYTPWLITIILWLLINLIYNNYYIIIRYIQCYWYIIISFIYYHSINLFIYLCLWPLFWKCICIYLINFINNNTIIISSYITISINYSIIIINIISNSSSISININLILISITINSSTLIIIINSSKCTIN